MSIRALLVVILALSSHVACKKASTESADTTETTTASKSKTADNTELETEPANEVAKTPDAAGAGEHKAHGKHGEHAHGEHVHGEHAHGDKGPAPLGHRFEDADKWAKRFDKKGRKSWQVPAEVVKHLEISEGMHVVDIGAGTGYFLPYLSTAVGTKGTVVGLDIEKDMVRYMNERAVREKLPNVSAKIVATDDPGLAKSSVDRVLIVNTWHHLPERVGYAKKLADGLKPGGFVAIVDFTMEADHGPKKSHRLLPDSIIKELEGAGLAAETIKEALPDQYIVVGRKK